MSGHRLDPLLRPRSIALVGASGRAGAFGNTLARQLVEGGYRGRAFAVNPGYEAVEGLACHASLDDLAAPAEHVVLAVANHRLEAELDRALKHGARALTIFGSLHLEDDRDPPLAERVRAAARQAGVPLCGGNCMGFYNFVDGVRLCGYPTRTSHRAGGIAVISHSGSVFAALADTDERLDFGVIVSAGQELVTTAADYLDFALDMPETRVVGLFIETVRDPEGLIAGLERATAQGVPVVALKVGRSALGARMAATHSGALAGDDAAYQALFDRYGVARAATLDQFVTSLVMFAQPHPVGPGGLATMHDSGGERALAVDLAADAGVPYAALAPATIARLRAVLEPGLPPANPLDAWGTGHDFDAIYDECFAALMADPATALGAMVGDRGPGGRIWDTYPGLLRRSHAKSGKPLFLVSNLHGDGGDPLAVELTRAGFPMIDGLAQFLAGAGHLFAYRDFQARPAMRPPAAPADAIARWRPRLAAGAPLDEAEALALLGDFGLPANPSMLATSRDAAVATARALGFPVALKTAAPGIEHKTDAGGVALDLGDADAVARAYDAMAARLGPRVTVSPMVHDGLAEMILGIGRDPQFGPLVVIGIGGVHAEAIEDAVFGLPPFDAAYAGRMIDRLRLRRLLDGGRGRPPADVGALCDAAARLAALADALGPEIAALDVNPMIARADGCVAVDALVVPVGSVAEVGSSRRGSGGIAGG